ncbi:hypothetical protein JZO77_06160 [Enterococcus hulanensis]|uniref:hypothetical protein n=1 Tax=Enterococcus hulanensis TaxID=2559929 RepID=UPI001A8D2F60|nr:hypothetical protein [Enterococcus hulanensis]MBO0456321.1 hypothetical protein [Enterococcus hulanensis]
MGDKAEIQEKNLHSASYLSRDILYNAIQLNEHLSNELAQLQENQVSRISNRVIRLAECTAKITDLALSQISDIDAIIKNTMS